MFAGLRTDERCSTLHINVISYTFVFFAFQEPFQEGKPGYTNLLIKYDHLLDCGVAFFDGCWSLNSTRSSNWCKVDEKWTQCLSPLLHQINLFNFVGLSYCWVKDFNNIAVWIDIRTSKGLAKWISFPVFPAILYTDSSGFQLRDRHTTHHTRRRYCSSHKHSHEYTYILIPCQM